MCIVWHHDTAHTEYILMALHLGVIEVQVCCYIVVDKRLKLTEKAHYWNRLQISNLDSQASYYSSCNTQFISYFNRNKAPGPRPKVQNRKF